MRRRDGTRRVRPPVADVVHAAGYDPANPDQVFATIDSLRIPVEYMGNLITAGKADTVRTVLRKPAVVRAIMRAGQLGRSLDENLPASVGASVDDLEDLYRLLAIAKYEDRYVIPPAHAEDAGRLMGQHEQLFCSLDTDGGPDMGGTGPHGIQSYQPAVPPGENHSFRAGDGMVLDFAALAPRGETLLRAHRADLELLRRALEQAATPYADVVAAVCAQLPRRGCRGASAGTRSPAGRTRPVMAGG